MELSVYPERWNLPSSDPESLIAITYSKFCKAQVDLKRVEGLGILTRDLPSLISSFSDTPIHGFENIIEHLRYNITDTDSDLEGSQKSDIKVYSELVVDALLPALKHTLWLDASNFVDVSRPTWSSLATFPFSLLLPIHHRKKVQASFKQNLKYNRLSEEALSTQVINTGKEAINLLSTKLAHNTYFFGDKGCPNLNAYCQRFLEEVFPEHASKLAEARRVEEEKLKEKANRSLELGDFPNKKRDLLIGLGLAAASMLLYALLSGKLVKVVVVQDEGRDRRGM